METKKICVRADEAFLEKNAVPGVMTKYEYYDQLQEICYKAVKALSITEKEN